MTSGLAAISLIVELFTWIGLVAGALFLIIGISIGIGARRWVETSAAVIDDEEGLRVRWLATDRELYELPITPIQLAELPDVDDLVIFYDDRHPERCRFHTPTHDGRAVRITGWVLIITGVLAGAASIALLFAE
ncbi:sortase [Compostimonas suwonensis]|uniref:DUF3592 domain-containing protein n=1 Tax=Compostimonas suwonensis TaxID=1048394 RepID=A0A2M9C4S3_9MICO|nr:sortase [Compostimonas suwonensis]PJJ65531.1 hypothetical protein CLV54_0564 [Compostimonas suwonensis]